MGEPPLDAAPGSGPEPGQRRPPATALLLGIVAGLVPLVGLLPWGTNSLNASDLVAAGCALAVFIAIQAAISWSYHSARFSERFRLLLLAPLTVLSIVLPLWLGSAWLILLPYLAAATAVAVPPRLAVPGLLASVGLAALVVYRVPGGDSTAMIIMTVAVGLSMTTYRGILDLNEQLRRTQRELARAAVAEERLRFARDMHDMLGHSLLQIVLKAEVTRRLYRTGRTDPEAELREIETLGRQSLERVRQAVTGYRRLVLATAIEEARSSLTDAGIDVVVRTADEPLSAEVETVFSWVVREGVANVVRHSGATNCEIDIRFDAGNAVLEVLDDGTGPKSRRASGTGGNGLAGLAERVAGLDGRLTASGRPGGGFRLHATLPLTGVAS